MSNASLVAALHDSGFDNSHADDGVVRVRCSQCEAAVINGVPCHEVGCPNKPRYFRCYHCGCDVKVGSPCDCAEAYSDDDV